MNLKLAKPAGLLRLQVRLDHVHEIRQIGPFQPREHHAHMRRLERHLSAHELLDRLLAELAQVVVCLHRLAQEDIAPDARLVERHGQVGLLVARLLLVVELQIQPLAQKLQRRLRVGVVAEQRLAVLDHAPLLRVREALRPRVHQRRQLRLLLRVLKMERGEKVELLAPRNELPQHCLPVRREREFLDEADLIFPARQRREGEDGGEREEETSFHKRRFLGVRNTRPEPCQDSHCARNSGLGSCRVRRMTRGVC